MPDPASNRDALVWCIDLAAARSRTDTCLGLLSTEETARAARFLRIEDRVRFAASHAALRLILARALDAAPAELDFAAGAGGKPELAGRWAGRLAFNLSHSGARAVVGLARSARIGVDVEAVRRMPDALRIADHHFSPSEAAALRGLPAERTEAAFFAVWTAKEAVVKALGVGLAGGLAHAHVTVPPEPLRLVALDGSTARAEAWTLAALPVAAGYAGAVALDAPAAVAVRDAPADWLDGFA